MTTDTIFDMASLTKCSLEHSGVRVRILELTHLSVRQYQRPNGEVIALLVIAPSKTDRERVIPMSAELFAVISGSSAGTPAPGRPSADPALRPARTPDERAVQFLFQRQLGTTRRYMSTATVLVMLAQALQRSRGPPP